jgi:hypothetical protein
LAVEDLVVDAGLGALHPNGAIVANGAAKMCDAVHEIANGREYTCNRLVIARSHRYRSGGEKMRRGGFV